MRSREEELSLPFGIEFLSVWEIISQLLDCTIFAHLRRMDGTANRTLSRWTTTCFSTTPPIYLSCRETWKRGRRRGYSTHHSWTTATHTAPSPLRSSWSHRFAFAWFLRLVSCPSGLRDVVLAWLMTLRIMTEALRAPTFRGRGPSPRNMQRIGVTGVIGVHLCPGGQGARRTEVPFFSLFFLLLLLQNRHISSSLLARAGAGLKRRLC
jgi:hypothetical protein